MPGGDRPDFGLSALKRDVAARTADIERRGKGRKAGKKPRLGAKLAIFLLCLSALLVALPPYAWPVRGKVTSGFFLRHRPDSNAILAIELHRGLDIAAAAGTPVRACAPGIVIETGRSPDLGDYVRVRHLFGLVSTYGHLSRIDVSRGRLILLRGIASLGAVGSTGRSTGPHLHFALQAGGVPLPPRLFLAFHTIRIAAICF